MANMPAVLMPNFWPTEAALWFRLLENQFFYCKITNQFTRFAILTPYLTEDVGKKRACTLPEVGLLPLTKLAGLPH